ncbi:MAG: phospho-N-acetylmuramoyl-pentapeptide-transferase [Nitrospirae bacterium]|nr:phospho-N-acetylmuramoyl-pentapeptide-transferase [Nitrospirota bacterium]
MLYHILYPLHDQFRVLNVFRYITFRTASAILTALLISFVLGPYVIRKLRALKVGQQVRLDGPETHLGKAGTPTMGGILILIAVIVPTLLWSDLTNVYVWLVVAVTLGFGLIGFADDYLKVVRKKTEGLKARYKFGWQMLIGLAVGVSLYFNPLDPYSTALSVPFFKQLIINLAWFYIPFVAIVLVGSSNAVNLTDGLDGLAIGLVGIAASANAVLVYVTGNKIFANYLQVIFIPGAGELTVFCGALIGASLGFLWFNSHPAEVFMGDVGSLALGGALGILAVLTKHEIILVIIGGIFVAEALSVMFQVASFKSTGKRIFKMAPIHHHFEKSGWAESKVIVRFWILGIMLALVGLSTLKLR